MSLLLDGSIAGLVGTVCGDLFGQPCTIRRRMAGVDDDGVPVQTYDDTAGVCTRLEYSERRRMHEAIPANDVLLLVYQSITPVGPRVGDLMVVAGETFAVVKVARDPAAATWEIQARPTNGG
jgi:hypothetical protein